MSNKNNWWEILDPYFLSVVAIAILLLLIGNPENPSDYNLPFSSDSLLVSAWQNYGTNGLILFLILISITVTIFIKFANKPPKS